MNSEQPGASGRRGIAPGVDLDLLADYAAGALEGSPEEERASRLVASDPKWAEALRSLRAADAMVQADLARLADTPQPIPADIATRLDLALHRARSDRVGDRASLSEGPSGLPGDHPESAGTTDRSEPVDLRAARLRRRFRIAAVASIAAGLLALAVPAGYLVLGQNAATDSESGLAATEERSDAGAPEAAPSDTQGGRQGPAALGDRTVPMTASGLDYSRGTISAVHGQRAETARTVPREVPEELTRLLAIPALDDCLTAIRAAYPGAVTIVDYARFEGAPALLVAITEATGGTRVVVAGPECGRSGIHERYSAAT